MAAIFLYSSLAVTALSALYFLAVMLASLRFRLQVEHAGAAYTPPVSILKPVRGVEPQFYENLASHCRQDYPQFEIIFGMSDPNDPARQTIAEIQRDFPGTPIKVVVVPESRYANRKMNNLRVMLEHASHEVILIDDADIQVGPGYLREVVRPLEDEQVGMVTCLYRGCGARNLPSVFEALGLSADFAGQVLLARWVEGVHFALGATMVTRKKQIAAIGGIASWADYLADDYILGNRIAAAGYRIRLSRRVVETALPRRSFADLLRHQLRWARTVRSSRPGGYTGLLLTFGVVFGALALVARPSSALAQLMFGVVLAVRLIAAWACGWLICRDPLVPKYFWLLPFRDLIAFGVWIVSFFGGNVVWGEERFRIEKGGKIVPAR